MSYQNDKVSMAMNDDGHFQDIDNISNKKNVFGKYAVIGIIFTVVITFVTFASTSNSKSSMDLLSSQAESLKTKSSAKMYSDMDKFEKQNLFFQFKIKYNKAYANHDEESERMQNFFSFLERVDAHNALEAAIGSSAVHSITKFADLTPSEFDSSFKGFNNKNNADIATIKSKGTLKTAKDIPKSSKYTGFSTTKSSSSSSSTETTAVTSADWVGIYSTPIKDQGNCGSCWAFSASAQIESDSIRAGLLNVSLVEDRLSEQQLVSCDDVDWGCQGGVTVYAYYYVYQAGGIQSNATYPYTSYYAGVWPVESKDESQTCEATPEDFLVTVTDYSYFETEYDMQEYVLTTGPLSVCLSADNWDTYESGILSVCSTDVDHCVQIVGVDVDEGYWLIRNSWGTDWGLDGYIKLALGSNLCDITYLPTFVDVKAAAASLTTV